MKYISLHDMMNASIAHIKTGVPWEDSAPTNIGNRSVSANTGAYSASTNTGNEAEK